MPLRSVFQGLVIGAVESVDAVFDLGHLQMAGVERNTGADEAADQADSGVGQAVRFNSSSQISSRRSTSMSRSQRFTSIYERGKSAAKHRAFGRGVYEQFVHKLVLSLFQHGEFTSIIKVFGIDRAAMR